MKRELKIAALACLVACGDPQGTYNYVLTVMGGRTVTKDPWAVASEYRDAHRGAASIVDLHADTLLLPDEGSTPYERLLTNPDRDGHVDVPRMIEGNVALQVFSAGVKGSLDTLGDSLPAITGKYVAPDGTQHSRYGYERDPNVAAYDDPNDPYADDYAGAPLYMPREVGSYVFRLAGRDCKTWYDGGNWEASLFGDTPPCPGFDAERMYLERYLSLATRLRGADAADARLRLITTRAQLDALIAARATNKNLVGGLLSTEGLYFRSDASTASGRAKLLANFDELYTAGYRMFALTHFIDNDHGGSSTGMAHAHAADGSGLTAAGQLLAEQALTRGATLDVAHASRATLASLAALARSKQKPVVFSHGGIKGIPGTEGGACWNERNIEAAQLREIASTGGVVGIGFAEEFVCDTDPSAWAKAVRYAVDVIDNGAVRLYGTGVVVRGVDSVGLGSDYDGGIEAYTDIAHLEQYTRALICKRGVLTPSCLERPFTVAEAHKILGGNSLRVLRANLP